MKESTYKSIIRILKVSFILVLETTMVVLIVRALS
jgi:hypothetical protein